jgi:phosphoserine phosphatase RsbU/P
MRLSSGQLRYRIAALGLWPASRLGRLAWYVLGLDLLFFVLQKILEFFTSSWSKNLGGWVSFLSFLSAVLFSFLFYRWVKTKILWRLRNRLLVTYVFIGVIPVVLLVTLSLGTFYLFAGQFATYVLTSGLDSRLANLRSSNTAVARDLATRLQRTGKIEPAALGGIRHNDETWADRQVTAWLNGKLVFNDVPQGITPWAPTLPAHIKASFSSVVRDHGRLYLRAVESFKDRELTVVSSEPFDQQLLGELANNLGEVTLYASGVNLQKVDRQPESGVSSEPHKQDESSVREQNKDGSYVLDTRNQQLTPTYSAGSAPPPTRSGDREVIFPTSIFVVNWDSGDTTSPAVISVHTRLSKLYDRLFGALGNFAPTVEAFLLFVAIVFAIIELLALLIGSGLTRSVTKAVAQLYDATKHINRGDFSHRIPVKSNDQLATLAYSFNSMTASIEQLIEEQREKQRLQNELTIAHEVQEQLFPKQITQLESLEVHGFCRPARTVSGDYYDFLTLNGDKMLLAVGDISGKGISAALLMATIHSAVRAYCIEGSPVLREPVAVGAGAGAALMATSASGNGDLSPATLLALLNHQLYLSTPMEKYATLFLGYYDGQSRRLTYTNGGHLPPLIIGEHGVVRRLQQGGTVVGLFDNLSFEEAPVQLEAGELFVAYSDGVTEPENEFGEFGEQRLIELVRENRHLPLARITEIVTAAVDDWIGPHEQPDDVTLVLARAR